MVETPFPEFPLHSRNRVWTADGTWGLEYEPERDVWRLYNADHASSDYALPADMVRRIVAEAGTGENLMRHWDNWDNSR